jgi:hypothetical protein
MSKRRGFRVAHGCFWPATPSMLQNLRSLSQLVSVIVVETGVPLCRISVTRLTVKVTSAIRMLALLREQRTRGSLDGRQRRAFEAITESLSLRIAFGLRESFYQDIATETRHVLDLPPATSGVHEAQSISLQNLINTPMAIQQQHAVQTPRTPVDEAENSALYSAHSRHPTPTDSHSVSRRNPGGSNAHVFINNPESYNRGSYPGTPSLSSENTSQNEWADTPPQVTFTLLRSGPTEPLGLQPRRGAQANSNGGLSLSVQSTVDSGLQSLTAPASTTLSADLERSALLGLGDNWQTACVAFSKCGQLVAIAHARTHVLRVLRSSDLAPLSSYVPDYVTSWIRLS